jgi:hypothetical protein
VKPGYGAGENIYGQRQPRPSGNGLSLLLIDENDIDFRMVDLHDFEQSTHRILTEFCGCRLDDVAFATHEASDPPVDGSYLGFNGSPVGRRNALLSAPRMDLRHKMRNRRTGWFEINLSDFRVDYPLDFARQRSRSPSAPHLCRLELINCAKLSIEFDQPI